MDKPTDTPFTQAEEAQMRSMLKFMDDTFDRLFPTEGIALFGEAPAKPNMCSCGAVIEADEHSCAGCHSEARREHDEELDRMFPSREP